MPKLGGRKEYLMLTLAKLKRMLEQLDPSEPEWKQLSAEIERRENAGRVR